MTLYSWCFITMGGSFCSNFSRGKREDRYKSPASVSLGRADSPEGVYACAASQSFTGCRSVCKQDHNRVKDLGERIKTRAHVEKINR